MTKDGEIVIAVSDTTSGGVTSLPLVIRQTGGPSLVGAPVADSASGEATGGDTSGAPTTGGTASPAPTAAGAPTTTTTGTGGRLPATGGGLAVLGALALAGATARRRPR